jgi:hypothetical protein
MARSLGRRRVNCRAGIIPFPLQGAVVGAPVVVHTDVVARAAGKYSRFEVRLNRDLIQDIQVSPLPGVAFEPVAIPASQISTQTATQSSLLLKPVFFPGEREWARVAESTRGRV